MSLRCCSRCVSIPVLSMQLMAIHMLCIASQSHAGCALAVQVVPFNVVDNPDLGLYVVHFWRHQNLLDCPVFVVM
jgi:hypothetical protein